MSVPTAGKPTALVAAACTFVLIEDDPLLLDLLADALRQRFKPAALHKFAEAKPALAFCLRESVDLVLTDLRLPDADGRDILRQLRQSDRKPRVIVLTGQVDAALPAELVALGVAGFVDKATPLEHALRAVERVLAGGMYFFAGVMPAASGITARRAAADSVGTHALTPRERDVARLVAGGLSSKEIAQRLDLSTRTVENYRANLMQKLGVRDTAGLIRWCLERGLV